MYRRGRIWWCAWMVAGKRHYRSLETADEIEAIRRTRAILADPYAAAGLDRVRSWESAVEVYVAAKRRQGVSTARLTADRNWLLAFGEELGAGAPHDVRTSDVEEWFLGRMRTCSPRTAVECLGLLKRFYSILIEHRRATVNPAAAVKAPKVRPTPRRRFLGHEEVGRLIETPCDDWLHLCVLLALHAGLRKGECIAARPGWFDLDSGLLHVQPSEDWCPKDREARTIPMTDRLRDFVRIYGLREPYMIRPDARQGRWRYRYDFRRPWVDLVSRAGLVDVRFHDLRRTFASLHVSSGTSIYKVARWMGDGVAVVERHYGHLVPADEEINRAWR